MYSLKGKVAVVTGAGSGIGRALAQLLSAKGCTLALADINEVGLKETAASLPTPPLLQKLGTAHIVINNAGVAVSQTVENLSYEDFEWIMGINFWGVVYGTKAFLPMLTAQNNGVIVNLSSVFGIIAVPTQGSYNAAKFAVRGFTEALRHELDGSGVTAISVHPGGIKTNIAAASRFYVDPSGVSNRENAAAGFAKMAKTTPEQAAQTIVDGIERGSKRVLIGADAKLIDIIQRLMPVNYWKPMSALMRSMRK